MDELIEILIFVVLAIILLPRIFEQPRGKATAASPNEPIRY